MDGGGSDSDELCYYSILQIRKNATAADVRAAYRKLALKWHPDRWARDAKAAGEANSRFQRIQEAYSVLSNEAERAMYDAGLFDPFQDDDDDDEVDITDFVQELRSMMDSMKSEKQASLEELRQMWADIAGSGKGQPAQATGTAKATKGRGAAPAQGGFGGNHFGW